VVQFRTVIQLICDNGTIRKKNNNTSRRTLVYITLITVAIYSHTHTHIYIYIMYFFSIFIEPAVASVEVVVPII
jgi:hypothetical protein